MTRSILFRTCLPLVLLLGPGLSASGQAQQGADQGVPVTLDGEVILQVHASMGAFSPAERAAAGESRILRLAEDPFYEGDLIRIESSGGFTHVFYLDRELGVVTPEDAAAGKTTTEELAARAVHALKSAIESYRERRRPEKLWRAAILLALDVLALVAALWGLRAAHRGQMRRLTTGAPSGIALWIKQRLGIPQEIYVGFARGVLKLLRVSATMLVVIAFAQFAFRTIPMTRGYTLAVLDYLLAPLDTIWMSFLEHVGDLFFVLVLIVLVHYLLVALRGIARLTARGAITLPGIAPEWALPIYKILRIAVIGLAVVMAYPYIPGSHSDAFKGVSILAGAVFTLGASGTAASFIGGLVLIFMRTYRLGDWIQVGDTSGDVIEANMLLTRIRTAKNEVVTIPNSQLLSGQIVNYSAMAREEGLIVHTSVTIGYDAPWRKVHEIMLGAAARTAGILETPPPFVLQTSLNDYNITYQLNAYTREANALPQLYGELHQNIQDSFQEGGVEILSPAYNALRDGNRSTIPARDPPR